MVRFLQYVTVALLLVLSNAAFAKVQLVSGGSTQLWKQTNSSGNNTGTSVYSDKGTVANPVAGSGACDDASDQALSFSVCFITSASMTHAQQGTSGQTDAWANIAVSQGSTSGDCSFSGAVGKQATCTVTFIATRSGHTAWYADGSTESKTASVTWKVISIDACPTGEQLDASGVCVSVCISKNGNKQALDFGIGTAVGDTVCDADTGCAAKTNTAGRIGLCFSANCPSTPAVSYATYNGSPCSGNPNGTATKAENKKTLADGTPGACQSGTNNCVSQTKSQCGYVDNVYRCYTSTQFSTAGCVSDANGGKWCTSGASDAPDNGTAGQAATPNAAFSLVRTDSSGNTTTQGVNYYSPGTVSGSSGYNGVDGSGGTGSTTGSTTGGSTTAGTTTSGTTTGDDSDDETCDGCRFTGPSHDDAQQIGDSISGYWSAIQSAPIVQGVTGLGSAIPTGGTMPSATFNAFNRTYTLAVPSQVADAITPILSLVMYAVWVLTALYAFWND